MVSMLDPGKAHFSRIEMVCACILAISVKLEENVGVGEARVRSKVAAIVL
jgi:hypothetical protein